MVASIFFYKLTIIIFIILIIDFPVVTYSTPQHIHIYYKYAGSYHHICGAEIMLYFSIIYQIIFAEGSMNTHFYVFQRMLYKFIKLFIGKNNKKKCDPSHTKT